MTPDQDLNMKYCGGFLGLITSCGDMFRCRALVTLLRCRALVTLLLSHFLFNLGINATFALSADRALHLGISPQVKVP